MISWSTMRAGWAALLALTLAACTPNLPNLAPVAQAPTAPPLPAPSVMPEPSATPRPSPTPRPSVTPSPIPTVEPSATPELLPPTATLAPLTQAQRSEIFGRLWRLVRDRYVYPDYRGLDWNAVRKDVAPRAAAAETPEQFYAVLREMIHRLGDDHSRFESPQEVVEEQAVFDGDLRYAGVGAEVRELPDGALITKIAHGGPAEQAGLRPRDLILAIGGVPISDTARFGPDGPIGAVRGPPGSTVRLTVRSPSGVPREVTLTRRAISSDAFTQVEAQRLPGGRVGLLRIDTFFVDELDQRVREALGRLTRDGPLEGLIIDVRENGGGRIDLMLATIGLFADGGTIGSSSGRAESERLRVPKGDTLSGFAKTPIVVLIGPETASAAEMFAAGMRSLGRVRIVGTTSAGNTENLVAHDFTDGSRLWLAELVYRLPDGRLIEGQGVRPDRAVDAEWWRFDPPDDPQIQAALDEIYHHATASAGSGNTIARRN